MAKTMSPKTLWTGWAITGVAGLTIYLVARTHLRAKKQEIFLAEKRERLRRLEEAGTAGKSSA
ncbi:uncharacterized protein V1510DRAFT_402833 [Dipodascopsis tothii]|uniref:uncharacterized protein n=1 Tax=Dipodascopsis tothii TaxID=44089 RepID=UPI0034CFBAE9